LIRDGSKFVGWCYNRSRLTDPARNGDINDDLGSDNRGVHDMTNRAPRRRLKVLVMMPEIRRGQEKQNTQGKTSEQLSAI